MVDSQNLLTVSRSVERLSLTRISTTREIDVSNIQARISTTRDIYVSNIQARISTTREIDVSNIQAG
jgi:hypothetical protein